LQEEDGNCGDEEQGDPPWDRISMGAYRDVEEEKNKGGQEDGARPRDHRLDAEDKTFRGVTCGAGGEAAAKGDKKENTESDGAK
jgi:hypothetical protein